MSAPDKINLLVTEAKELRENGELSAAKNKYLDAAHAALSHAKTLTDSNKLTFENIVKALINEAKEVQEEIFLARLPEVPLKKKKIHTTYSDDLRIKQIPHIYSLYVIKEGGIPLITHNFDDTESTINEVLFSGAITAINSLMFEAIDRPIHTINFDKGVLIIQTHDNVHYVLYAEQDAPGLNRALKKFCRKLEDAVAIPLNSFKMNRDITHEESTVSLIKEIFPQKI